MIKIKLTEEQLMVLKPLFDKAQSEADKGAPGMIICQPFPRGTPDHHRYGDSNGIMRCDFMPTSASVSLINVMDEHQRSLKNESSS